MKTGPTSKQISVWSFFKYFKPYTWLALATMVFLIATVITTTVQPLYLRYIIDDLTAHKASTVIFGLLIIYFAISGASYVFQYLRDYLWSPVMVKISRDIEGAVFQHLLLLSVDYHADQKSGSAVRAVVRGAQAVTMILDFTVSQIFPPFLQLIIVTAILLKLFSWQFGVITFVTILVYTWFILWSNEKRISFRIEGNAKDDAASGILIDTVGNIETVKYFNNGNIFYRQWQNIKAEWVNLLTRNNRLFAIGFMSQSFILLIGLGGILYLAIHQTITGAMTIGGLILVSTYIVQLSGPIAVLGFVYGQYKNAVADLQAMAEILQQGVTILEPTKPKTIDDPKGKIEFKDVTFNYNGRQTVIDKLSLEIKAGQKVAFVGDSGAGKSTITKLMFRLYDVTKGEIMIDGVDLRQLSANSRRELLAIVPQEPALFNDTIGNNIKFGNPESTQAEIKAAAASAHIDEFIDSLPDKYDTLVGERGTKISGGQKQRVAIARAMVKNPKIIVFDEATSSLDSKSEQAILKTLDEVASGRTTVAVAHRLSTIVNSDVIYVLQSGKIVESGSHDQLLKKNGVYAHLWQIQSHAHTKLP